MDNFLKKLGKISELNLDFSSLQFRLTWGIILILTLGISALMLGIDWEIKQFFITTNDTELLVMLQHLQMMSLLSMITMIVIATVFIRRSLLPLQQMTQWVENGAANLHPLKFSDIPKEIKILAQNWKKMLAMFSEVKEQQRHFTNNLAHELRTPLTLVSGYLQRSQKRNQGLTDFQKEALAMAIAEAQRMTQLLQDWLDLARSDNSLISLQMEALILNDLVKEVTDMTEKFKHRVIQVQIPAFAIKIKADRTQVMQVLSHLLENAVKYSDPTEPITVKLTKSEEWAMIQVSDRGCGIPQSQQARIFDPLYRVDPSRTRATGGTGLGLSLVKSLVEKMGGTISVQSQLNKGSTFILMLPILGVKP